MSNKYIGAHIPKNKNIINTINTIIANNGNALQIFVSNPRSAKIGNIENFKKEKIPDNFKLVIHSPYIINLAKEFKNDKRIIDISDCYWINLIIYELEVADLLKAVGCVIHVGKYTTLTEQEGLKNMFLAIKYIVSVMMQKNLKTKLIIETPAGQGTELLSNLDDFVNFYDLFSKEEKEYLGICLDTAHVWATGYNLMEAYNKFNPKDIKVIHLNNSKKNIGSRVDVHEEILKGKIDKEEILNFIENLKFNPIIILEKPSDDLNNEFNLIKLYYNR